MEDLKPIKTAVSGWVNNNVVRTFRTNGFKTVLAIVQAITEQGIGQNSENLIKQLHNEKIYQTKRQSE